MIFFKTFAILSVVFVIVFIKNIHATSPPSAMKQAAIDFYIRFCLEKIGTYFPGNDLRAHAKTAMKEFYRFHDKSGCASTFNPNKDIGDVFGYYSSFEAYLGPGSIQSVEAFCNVYVWRLESNISPSNCISLLNTWYGKDQLEAVKKVFYTYLHKNIMSLNTLGKEKANILIMEYWEEVEANFELNTGDNGMPSPASFCQEQSLDVNK